MVNNNHHKYEYVDEPSIDTELMCSICNKPFVEPVSTPCDHTFCSGCITHWVEKKRKSCPICRLQIKSTEEFTKVSRPLRNILDRLQIKCSTCGQTGLTRDSLDDHLKKICPKMTVSCPGADIKCPWTGSRDEVPQHLPICKFESLRFLLGPLIIENEQLNTQRQQWLTEKQKLTEQIKKQNIQINELTNKLSTISEVQPLLEKTTETEVNSTMDFSQKKVTDQHMSNIAQKLMNKSCTILQLQGNSITSQGISILLDALSNNSKTLKDLWLSNNCIGDIGVQILVESFLSSNSTIKNLHLGSNCITDCGVGYLVNILEYNSSISDLWLYNNQITDRGVRHLLSIFDEDNTSLKHLDLQWNKLITDSSVNLFVKILQRNRSLERLNLRKCNISINGKMQLLQAVAEKKDFKLII